MIGTKNLSTIRKEIETALASTGEDPIQRLEQQIASVKRKGGSAEVIEGLATSVEPLKDSVNNLNATMIELVALMAPMASAEHGMQNVEHGVHDVEHGVHRIERFLGFRRHTTASQPATKQLEPDADLPPTRPAWSSSIRKRRFPRATGCCARSYSARRAPARNMSSPSRATFAAMKACRCASTASA